MHAQVSSSDSFCNFTFFDCFSTKEEATRNTNNNASLRQTTVHYQQPHLVEPMKLTVYEDLPTTPLSATNSRPFFSRATTASRASSRTSIFSIRKRVSHQSPRISKPVPQANSCNDLPLRRRRAFRPLELSIYVERHRLSDLPEFDRLSFTDFGELKDLDRVLSRPQSAVLPPLQHTPLLALQDCPKSASMYEIGTRVSSRPQTSYSTTSMSRPPSEYDALHSHPVSWASLPGLSITTNNHKVDRAMTILTPMQEEFSPDVHTVPVGDTILTFPKDEAVSTVNTTSNSSPQLNLAAPAPVISRGIYHDRYRSRSAEDISRLNRSSNLSVHRQSIGQWLAARQRAGSTISIATTATTTSFAEHHRRRNEFYQLGQHAQVTATHTAPAHDISNDSDTLPFHRRTITGSTIASTVDTEILSYDSRRASADTWTTASDMLRSQSGTVKSIASPGGRKIVTSTVTDMGILTPMRGQVYVVDQENPYLDDIRGRIRAPGIGMAF